MSAEDKRQFKYPFASCEVRAAGTGPLHMQNIGCSTRWAQSVQTLYMVVRRKATLSCI